MNIIDIPNYKLLNIKNIVLDYNGTIATNGKVLDSTKELLKKLSKSYNLYVITADTFGSVKKELKELNIEVIVLSSSNHTKEKANFIKKVGAQNTVAVGNGNNDTLMLKAATLAIAIIGNEGCATKTLLASDICAKDIEDVLNLFILKKSLVATLRS